MTGLVDFRLDNNPLKTPPSEVCVGGILQPIGLFLKTHTSRQGEIFIIIISSALKTRLYETFEGAAVVSPYQISLIADLMLLQLFKNLMGSSIRVDAWYLAQ